MIANRQAMAFLMAALFSGAVQAQVNLASAREGGRVVASSSVLDEAGRAENAIDEDPSTTWATGDGKTENEWIIIRLAGDGVEQIGAVALDNTPASGHPDEAGLRDFRVSASTTGRARADFRSIHIGSCRMTGGRQVFSFVSARAKFVKLTIRRNHGYADWAELAEIEIYAAGSAPTSHTGTPSVLIHSTAATPGQSAFGVLAEALGDVGATLSVYPGADGRRPLSNGALMGVRVVVTGGSSGAPVVKEALQALGRFVRRGGGLVCAYPDPDDALQPLLNALDVTVSDAGDGPFSLAPHWITEGLSIALDDVPPVEIDMLGGDALMELDDGGVLAVAGTVGGGRLVVLPPQIVAEASRGGADARELLRRATLWAAAMEDIGMPEPAEPVALSGEGVFLDGGRGQEWERSFEQLGDALDDAGLRVRMAPEEMSEFHRRDLDEADILIAFMPAFEPRTSLELADWVNSGGALLVLGEAGATVFELIAVNEFLREFGGAISASPTTNVTVAVRRHEATRGVSSVARPGPALGA